MNWRFWLSDKTVRKFEELPIYCQRQNCSPGILVYPSLCGYSRGFAREGASNESGVVVNGDFRFFRSLYLPNLHIQGSGSSLTPKGWPWMVILRQNLVRTRHPMGWRSGFRRKLFGNFQSYTYTVSGKKYCPAGLHFTYSTSWATFLLRWQLYA